MKGDACWMGMATEKSGPSEDLTFIYFSYSF